LIPKEGRDNQAEIIITAMGINKLVEIMMQELEIGFVGIVETSILHTEKSVIDAG